MKTLFVLCLLMVSCANKPYIQDLTDEEITVKVGRSDPSNDMEMLGEVVAISGRGCGGFGNKGSLADAYNRIKIKASRMEATYVQIMTIKEPAFDVSTFCLDNEYKITGLAYKKMEK